MREIGDDQVEAAAGHRLPHVAVEELGVVTELAEQGPAGKDGLAFDVDAAQGGRPQGAQGSQHDTAAASHFEDLPVANAFGLAAQDMDEGRGVLARPQGRGDRGRLADIEHGR